MKNIINRILKNISKYIIIELFLTFIFLFTIISLSLYQTNQQINDYLFKTSDIYILLYGDISDKYGHEKNITSLNNIKNTYDELITTLKQKDVEIIKEEYLLTSFIFSGDQIDNQDDFIFAYFDTPTINYQEGTITRLNSISRDIKNNKHYKSIYLESEDNSDFFANDYRNGKFISLPYIVGADTNMLDLVLNDTKLVDGRLFSKEEIINGDNVVIVSENTYLFSREQIKEINVNDEIPISIGVNDNYKTEYYKVIGLLRPNKPSYSIPNGVYLELDSGSRFSEDSLNNNVYIPDLSFKKIQNELLSFSKENDILITKNSNNSFDDDVIYYSQYGGIRPLYIKLNNINELQEIIDIVSEYTNVLNSISDGPIEYTFLSNIDSYITIIGSIISNSNIFILISVVAILTSLIVITAFIFLDINNNQFEFGILISLGEKFEMVILSKVIEYILLYIIPVITSSFLSLYLTCIYINNLKSKIISSSIDNLDIFNSYSFIPNMYGIFVIIIVVTCITCLITYIKMRRINIKQILINGGK